MIDYQKIKSTLFNLAFNNTLSTLTHPIQTKYANHFETILTKIGAIMKYLISILFIVCNLFAQDIYKQLVLTNGSERLFIPEGDWVVAVDSSGHKVLGTGRYLGMVNESLIFKEFLPGISSKGWWHPIRSYKYLKNLSEGRDTTYVVHSAPADEIATIYHGEAWRRSYYLKREALTSLRSGTVLAGTFALIVPAAFVGTVLISGRIDMEVYGGTLEFLMDTAGLMSAFYVWGYVWAAIFRGSWALPVCAGVGMVKHRSAKRYVIGPDQWEIVLE